jgi:hypothetical protein
LRVIAANRRLHAISLLVPRSEWNVQRLRSQIEEATMNGARKTPTDVNSAQLPDEQSRVREQVRPSERPRRQSDPNLSLDQRMESKLIAATALLAKLEPQDARARLLHIAVLRRDESLLDGILAELATPPTMSRRSR